MLFAAAPTPTPTAAPNPLAPDGFELVIGAVAFLIVFAVLAMVLIPRINRILEERTKAIDGGLKQAEDAQAEAARVLEEYQAELAQARHEAAQIRQQAVEQGAQIISEMQLQGAAEAQRLVGAARADIQDERERALASLRGDVGDFAVELASRVVGEPLDKEARQRRIVERFLADLEEGQIGEGSEIEAQ